MANNQTSASDIQRLSQRAITAAVSLNWNEAVKINQKILEIAENDIEALNRLARAKNCLGKISTAQKIYKRVLEIDEFNVIARKNLEKISRSKYPSSDGNPKNNGTAGNNLQNLSDLFLFEPGKNKLINLLNLAPPQVLSFLNCGDQVLINPKNHGVSVTTLERVYLGALPDDLAHRLIAFINGGNQYDAYVKCATLKMLTIFIREIYRSPKFASQPSFQYNLSHLDDQLLTG